MCGINGIFAYHGAANAPSSDELIATRDAMARRGPDGFGAWSDAAERVALAHRRLSILDLSDRAAQPMRSADGQLCVTFNGEIYNFPELREALEQAGAVFRTTSDTEVLLHLYAREGAGFVRRLRGMFAFALWDEQRQGLLLARDPYGIKPLYVADDGWTVRFASSVKALLAGGAVSRDPEPAGIVGFYLWGSVPEPFTLYRAVRALPAGSTQWIDEAGAHPPERYANVAQELAQGARRAGREPLNALGREAVGALGGEPVTVTGREAVGAMVREAALDTVRAHKLADVEVGVFLSAGIDSGALLGLMRETTNAPIRAVTLAFGEFKGTAEDETPLAAAVAQRYGASHHVRTVDRSEFFADLPAILEAMDQPSIDGVNTWFVSKAAAEAGLKVVLSGVGGDELLGGYPSFQDVPRWSRTMRVPSMIPFAGAIGRKVLSSMGKGSPKRAGFVTYAGTVEGAYLLRRGLFLPFELGTLLDADLAREGLQRLDAVRRLRAETTPLPGTMSARVAALESTQYLRNQLLRDTDWASMAHSLEVRTPLVDIDFLRHLAPVTARVSGVEGKRALGQAPQPPLPDAIVDRAKTGFGVPTGAWMAQALGMADGLGHKGRASRAWAGEVLQAAAAPVDHTHGVAFQEVA